MVYGQIIMDELHFFKDSLKKLKGNMGMFPPKELAQTIYSLSRVKQTEAKDIIREGLDEFYKVYHKCNSLELLNILWACSNSNISNDLVIKKMVKRVIEILPQ